MQSHFSKNLELLCSYYKSISEVCRRLDINRSQFNKYLKNTSQPSRNTLNKICTFFGIETYEIYYPSHQFANIVQTRPPLRNQHQQAPHNKALAHLQNQSNINTLEKYLGFYFEYYYSMSFPGQIIRSLVHISHQDNNIYYDRIEKLKEKNHTGPNADFKCHYQGIVFHLADRIFLIDSESLTNSEITQTVLFTNHKSRTTYLTGLKLGVAADSSRTPTSVRVAYEILGKNINTKAALRLCGLFSEHSNNITSEIKTLVKNEIKENQYSLKAKSL